MLFVGNVSFYDVSQDWYRQEAERCTRGDGGTRRRTLDWDESHIYVDENQSGLRFHLGKDWCVDMNEEIYISLRMRAAPD